MPIHTSCHEVKWPPARFQWKTVAICGLRSGSAAVRNGGQVGVSCRPGWVEKGKQRVQPPLEAVAVAGQQFEEGAAVLVVVEAGLAGLAAVEDMVAGGSGLLRAASGAGHDGTPRGFWVADPLLAPRRVAYPCRPLWQVAPPSRGAFLSQVLEKKRLG